MTKISSSQMSKGINRFMVWPGIRTNQMRLGIKKVGLDSEPDKKLKFQYIMVHTLVLRMFER